MRIIIQPSYGFFEPSKEFQDFLEKKGYSYWGEMKARTDQDVIAFVEMHYDNGSALMGKEDEWGHRHGHVRVVEVDIKRPWLIDEYDGAESIQYIDYEVVDPKINLCKFKG